jgi:hypothetical protein
MRTPKPWYRSHNDTWYVCLNGKQVPLAMANARNAKPRMPFTA